MAVKVLTIFGTRPEIIRLSRVMDVLDRHCDHVTVHTGQNYHESLSDVFLRDLKVRTPDHHLGIRASSFGEQAARIIAEAERMISEVRPDRVLILGDTNSALSAITAARMGVPVFHMEAGNRCYDDRVPEEINRRIVDHSSAVLLPYTQRSKENLVREGIDRDRIYVTGNPIKEVIDHHSPDIDASEVMEKLGVKENCYFLVTIHRAENVDDEARLRGIVSGLESVAEEHGMDMLVSVHPRTADKLEKFGIEATTERLRLLDPLGFFDFVRLERSAFCVLTDSGTVQEECCIFGVPNVTVRDVTERPETIECGSNILSGADPARISSSVRIALAGKGGWEPPAEYLAPNVSETVSRIILGHHSPRKHS